MFNLNRILGGRRKPEQIWSDTEISPPDTVMVIDEERLLAAESEWLTEEFMVSTSATISR